MVDCTASKAAPTHSPTVLPRLHRASFPLGSSNHQRCCTIIIMRDEVPESKGFKCDHNPITNSSTKNPEPLLQDQNLRPSGCHSMRSVQIQHRRHSTSSCLIQRKMKEKEKQELTARKPHTNWNERIERGSRHKTDA